MYRGLFTLLFVVATSLPACAQETGIARDGAEPIMCTMDAKVCPDGSYVSRQGPDCQFAPCPGEPGYVAPVPPADEIPPTGEGTDAAPGSGDAGMPQAWPGSRGQEGAPGAAEGNPGSSE